MFANLVFEAIITQLNWPLGAALSLLLLSVLGTGHALQPFPRDGPVDERIGLMGGRLIRVWTVPVYLFMFLPIAVVVLLSFNANLREDMRVDLKHIQHRIGVTSIFVTHDQAEALAMSDQIVVMSDGRVEQVGPPEEVYNAPASDFVANFLGASNILPGQCTARRGGTRCP